jgi:hypothetical protein
MPFPPSVNFASAGTLIVFALKSARIAALILIGDAGAMQIAVHGFHSQAG